MSHIIPKWLLKKFNHHKGTLKKFNHHKGTLKYFQSKKCFQMLTLIYILNGGKWEKIRIIQLVPVL